MAAETGDVDFLALDGNAGLAGMAFVDNLARHRIKFGLTGTADLIALAGVGDGAGGWSGAGLVSRDERIRTTSGCFIRIADGILDCSAIDGSRSLGLADRWRTTICGWIPALDSGIFFFGDNGRKILVPITSLACDGRLSGVGNFVNSGVLTNSIRPFSTMILAAGGRIPVIGCCCCCLIFNNGIDDGFVVRLRMPLLLPHSGCKDPAAILFVDGNRVAAPLILDAPLN